MVPPGHVENDDTLPAKPVQFPPATGFGFTIDDLGFAYPARPPAHHFSSVACESRLWLVNSSGAGGKSPMFAVNAGAKLYRLLYNHP